MRPLRPLFIAILIATSAVSLATAQNRIRPPEEAVPSIQRETVTDEAGLQQWAPFKGKRCPLCKGQKVQECSVCKRLKTADGCPSCEGDRKSPCRECFGTGKTWDPLDMMPCPGCAAEGMIPCRGCGGRGDHMVQGGGDKPQKCEVCKGARVFECKVCDGDRHIPAVKPKKSLRNDALEDLQKTKAAVEEVKAALATWKGEDRSSKAVKSYEKVVKPVRKQLPAVKDLAATMKEVLKGLDKGRMWVGSAQKIADEQAGFRDRTIWMLDHTLLLLDRCIERAEANAAVTGNAKK